MTKQAPHPITLYPIPYTLFPSRPAQMTSLHDYLGDKVYGIGYRVLRLLSSGTRVLVCGAVIVACGPEVKARDAPPLDGMTATPAQSVPATPTAANAGTLVARTTQARTDVAGSTVPNTTELTLPALVYSDLDAEITARAAGVISRVAAELGDAVRARQVLAVLEDARETARLEAARAAVERARAEHARVESMHKSNVITQADLDEARYQLSTAEAALRIAEVDLEHTRVLAPFAGVVTRRYAGQGRPVVEGEPLFRVTALQPLRALARLPEREARGLRRGTVGLLVADDGVEVEATVIRIAPAVDPGSGTVEVLFSIPRPGPFLPGSSATLRLARPGPRGK